MSEHSEPEMRERLEQRISEWRSGHRRNEKEPVRFVSGRNPGNRNRRVGFVRRRSLVVLSDR